MSDPIAFVRRLIALKVENGVDIDVGDHCRLLSEAFPELSAEQARAIVIETIESSRAEKNER